MPIKVMLADDNIDLTSALRRVLEFEPDIECVSCVADAREVVSEVARASPHVLLMDLSMPGGDAVAIVGDLHARAPGLHTIVFSGCGEDDRVRQVLDAGAERFVGKDTGPRQIVEAIRSVVGVSHAVPV